MMTASPDELDLKISKQIEFYFSDANLLRDKFLRQKMAEDDGWVTLETLLLFNRLKNLSTDSKVIIDSLDKHKNNLLEVDEKALKIRRVQSKPIPNKSFRKFFEEKQDLTVYLSTFPLDYTIEEISKFLDSHKIKRQFVKLIRDKEKKFNGCVYVILDDVDSYKILMSLETDLLINDTKLTIQTREQYLKNKDDSSKLDEEKPVKVEIKNGSVENKLTFSPFRLLRLKNIGLKTTREIIKDSLAEYKKIAWIDFSCGDKEGVIIFDQENDAKEMIKLFSDSNKLVINESEIEMELIEGEEETKYWEQLATKDDTKKNKYKRKAVFNGRSKKQRKN